MPSLHLDKKSGNYHARFRFQRISFKRSLKTKRQIEAINALTRIKETIGLLERGLIQVPSGTDPADFILSDGKKSTSHATKTLRLNTLFEKYNASVPAGAKEESTLKGEQTHQKHLLRHLGAHTVITSITNGLLQQYISDRSKDKTRRGTNISPSTVKKEMTTFRLIWNWAEQNEHVHRRCPTRGLKYPKQDEKPPFMTSADIHRIIGRGQLSETKELELWECLFLDSNQIEELLDEVQKLDLLPFIYPMFLLAAHTGARRSEIARSQLDDLDFGSGTIVIREKKRSRKLNLTFRRVPMTARLERDLKAWIENHPGGQFTIAPPISIPRSRNVEQQQNIGLTTNQATDHLKRTIGNTMWSGKLKGFHTLRHSFASNAAACGVDPMMIDSWLGHQTLEMRNRYRHLFPNQQRSAISKMFR